MKKKLTAIFLCIALVAIAIVGASMAYFTDTKEATNTFTVGNVKIKLLESSLHRENAGIANGQTSSSELWSDVAKEGSGNTSKYKAGDTFYTDEQIEENAETYTCENIQLIPGRSYHKMPYVKNVGNNDAYIRIRVMIPADLDTAVLNSSMYTSSAINKNEFTKAFDQTGSVERDNIKYNVYTFTRIDPLAPGEMTYWNVWGTIRMDTTVTSAQSEALFGENGIYPDGIFPVLVEADAIQSEGFANATAAWAAF
nr:SipW-dependent-type signal peptide-containing protein [uncultured Blautia sp.]